MIQIRKLKIGDTINLLNVYYALVGNYCHFDFTVGRLPIAKVVANHSKIIRIKALMRL